MPKIWMRLAAALAVLFALSATPAMAQATRTWVSGVGDDVNPCSRTAPCKTFAGAISKTAAGGEINCLDPGGFGTVTITKAMTINCKGPSNGGVLASATNGVIINAGPTDGVTLIGLEIEGGPLSAPGINGVRILAAGDVLIQDCNIHGFTNASSGAGVSIATSVTTRVTIDRTNLHSNLYGLRVTSTGSTGHAKVLNSLILDNSTAALSVDGAGNDIFIRDNNVFGPVGLQMLNGGIVRSYGGNLLTTAPAPSQTMPLQ